MQNLRHLSDHELIGRLRSLTKKEQALTLEIVSHLVEVARRGLHLARGYGSLYEYCKGELGYTDASAWRRSSAAQAIIRCPEAWDRLREGAVNLCTLRRVHKFVTHEVLREISGKSKAEVELIAAAFDAKGASPDRTRPVMVPKVISKNTPDWQSSAASPQPARSDILRLRSEVNTTGRDESDAADSKEPIGLPSEVAPGENPKTSSLRSEVLGQRLEYEQKWKIEGLVSKETKSKLDRCKSLLSRKYPKGVDYEILLGELAEVFLERTDPERRQKRRKQRETTKTRRTKTAPTPAAPDSRHIPAREKEKVWVRDKGRCSYVGGDGRRCNSTYNLQFDHHPVPFARGGPNRAVNLRLLCAAHNKLEAEKVYGKSRMEKFNPRIKRGPGWNGSDDPRLVRESGVSYAPSVSLTPDRTAGNLVLSDARGVYGFS